MGRRVPLADVHCHLDQLAAPAKEVTAAKRAGVRRLLSCSEELESMKKNLELAKKHTGVLPGLGIHPAVLVEQDDAVANEELDFIRAHIHEAAFLGEVGLDFLHATTPLQQERQKKILFEQFEIAANAGLPVSLHSRRAQRPAMMSAFRYVETYGKAALLHWFTQSVKLALEVNRHSGVYMSAGPAILINAGARKVAAAIDLDQLLVETDTPVPFGGEESRPSWIPRIVETIAQIRRLKVDDLARQLEENLNRYLTSADIV
jgi:TatD DNase family protein